MLEVECNASIYIQCNTECFKQLLQSTFIVLLMFTGLIYVHIPMFCTLARSAVEQSFSVDFRQKITNTK